MILFYLLFFFIVPINASYIYIPYVEAIVQINKILPEDKKIPGILKNNDVDTKETTPFYIDSEQVIQYFITSINSCLLTKSETVRSYYKSTKNVLTAYNGYIENNEPFPFFQGDKQHPSHNNNDLTQVDFFLKQICNSFVGMARLEETLTFNLLFYVHRYHQAKDELDETRTNVSISEQLAKTNALQLSTARIDQLTQSIKTLTKDNFSLTAQLKDKDQKCLDILNNTSKPEYEKLAYETLAYKLVTLCEEKKSKTEIDELLKQLKNSTLPFEILEHNILKLKLSLLQEIDTSTPLKDKSVRIPSIEPPKSNPYLWFLTGCITCLLLQKGYAYCF
jgi:hypothetical protein